MRMLTQSLNQMSTHLLAANQIRPLASGPVSRRIQRACQNELRLQLPDARCAGNGSAAEQLRETLVRRLTAAASAAPDEQNIAVAAQEIHLLLNAASWCDVTEGDAYRYDPCEPDAAFAETACTLAAALNQLRKPLAGISPALPKRIEAELNRRLLPAARSAAGLDLESCCLLLMAVLLGTTHESQRWSAVQTLSEAIDRKIRRLPADGSMPGGIRHATDAMILLMDLMEVIRAATGNAVDLTLHDWIIRMADYPIFAHLNSGWFIDPGKPAMRQALNAEGLFRFGFRASDNALCELAAWLSGNDQACVSPHLISRLLDRNTLPEMEKSPARIRLLRDGFLPDAGIMFMRGHHLHISMTGATGTSHADAGNICLFRRETPVLIDIGGDACATQLHSLPTIGGFGQKSPVPLRETECAPGDDSAACFTANLTAAYPPECHVTDYQRTLLMGAGKTPRIRLIDMLELSEPMPVDFHFICAAEPKSAPGGMRIGGVLLKWNGDLTASIEPLPDYPKIYRLTLRADAALRQQYMFDFIYE